MIVTTGARSDGLGRARSLFDGLDELVLDRRFLERLRGVAHLLDDERRRVLIEDLVDRDHHAHLHEGLDDLVGLDGHLLREVADRDRVSDLDFAHDGLRRLLECVLRIDVHGHRAAALLLLLAAPPHAVGDVQRVVAVARLLDHALFLRLLARALRVRTLL